MGNAVKMGIYQVISQDYYRIFSVSFFQFCPNWRIRIMIANLRQVNLRHYPLQSSIESDMDGIAGGGPTGLVNIQAKRYSQSELMAKDKAELKGIIKELQHRVQQTNSRLLRQLKTRAKKRAQIQTNCDVITACLQAKSLKREVKNCCICK